MKLDSNIGIIVEGDLVLDANDQDIILKDGGTEFGRFINNTSFCTLSSSTKGIELHTSNSGDGNIHLNAAGNISLDSNSDSDFTVDGGDFILRTTTSGEVKVVSAESIGLSSGSNFDVKVTGGKLVLPVDSSTIGFGVNSNTYIKHTDGYGLKVTRVGNGFSPHTTDSGHLLTPVRISFGGTADPSPYYIERTDGSTLTIGTEGSMSFKYGSIEGIQMTGNNVGGSSPGTITMINGASHDNVYRFKVNGRAQAVEWSPTSDDRLKESESFITGATTTLKKLKPQIYLKKDSIDTTDTTNAITESGLIAQEVYYQAPELRHLISMADDATPAETITIPADPTQDPDYSSWGTQPAGLNYDGLIAYLIKSVQELSARIDILESN